VAAPGRKSTLREDAEEPKEVRPHGPVGTVLVVRLDTPHHLKLEVLDLAEAEADVENHEKSLGVAKQRRQQPSHFDNAPVSRMRRWTRVPGPQAPKTISSRANVWRS
jgi:hypothetical protein